MNKKTLVYSLIGLLLFLAIPTYFLSQSKQTQEVTASTFEASLVEPFAGLEALEEFIITDQEENHVFSSDGEKLVNKELPMIEDEAIWDFIGQVVSLQALTLEKAPEHTSLEKMTAYTFVQDETFQITLELYALTDADSYIGVVTQKTGDKESEEVLEFTNLPLAVSDFSLLYLESPLDLKLGSLAEITYQDRLNTFSLSQESDLSQVEQSPFISGWFLHEAYQTEFSVEYQQMESLLTTLRRLHSRPLEDVEPTEAALLDLKLVDGDQQSAHLVFYPNDVDTVSMHWQDADQWFLLPQSLVDQLRLEPQVLIDNFIALIPLDAVESVSLEGLQNMTIKHQVEQIGDGETAEELHQFTFDGHTVEETAFRKVYQYLAALTYQDLLEEAFEPTEEAVLTITYQFLSEGESLKQVIHFYDLDDDHYAVEKNGVLEFTASKAQIDEMLLKLTEFN